MCVCVCVRFVYFVCACVRACKKAKEEAKILKVSVSFLSKAPVILTF